MHLSRLAPPVLRRPRRTLRAQLALLYAAVFGLACAAVAAVAVIFKPDFLIRTSCSPAPHSPVRGLTCGQHTGLSFAGTVTHDVRLSQRLAVDGPDDEFRQLGQTLDGLFGRLEASFEAQRHFVANASHELRTPLTAEKTVLQVALADPGATADTLRSACTTALRWTEQQERLIDALLTLASSQRGIERWEPFDLAGVAAGAVAQQRQEAGRRGIRVDTDLAAAPVTGDPALAESLIANLAGNAIRHNTGGGRAEITTGVTAGRAVLTVGNTGPVIPPDEVERLFQPFQRLGSERIRPADGHGLGLAIVGAIAGVHHATLSASARPGGGLDVTVSFPLASGPGAVSGSPATD